MIVCSIVYSGVDHRKHQSSVSLRFMRGIHRWPVNSTHKGPVTRKMLLLDDVIMKKDLIPIDGKLSAGIVIAKTIYNYLFPWNYNSARRFPSTKCQLGRVKSFSLAWISFWTNRVAKWDSLKLIWIRMSSKQWSLFNSLRDDNSLAQRI